MPPSFSRLAIINRGEPAMRAIRAVRELNEQRDEAIRLIALYTETERDAMFVRRADEAYPLLADGAAAGEGAAPIAYLDYGALERALRAARADAAWVGWGFVAEHPEFAELCERLGIVFVGPDAAVMRLVGDKIASKQLAEESGIPVAPWSNGPVASVDDARRHAERIGFPLMIKATAGGGGRGIRRVDSPEELPAAFASAQAEALQAVGDATVLLEQMIAPVRHVEVQIVADGQGGAWAVGLRDCSYQRRNQKVIEESASPGLSAEQGREIVDAARRLALRAGYRGACTVEFLFEPFEQRYFFLEVNARLQVEHPVTEAVTGLDLVKLQLHVAGGGRLQGEPPAPVGHAIEARLNAEDPALGFQPAPGRIVLLRLPTGPGVRVDTGVAEGDVIPPQFDSMIAKLIAWGADREEALARLHCALAETMVVVDGGTTNQGFLLEILDRPEVRTGEVDTGWLDRLNLSGEIVPVRYADVALVQAAVELAEAETAADRARFYAFARRGRPQSGADLERIVELRHRGQSYELAVAQVAPARYRVKVDGETIDSRVQRLGTHERRLELHGRAYRTLTSTQGADVLVEVDGVPHRISRDDGGLVRNLAPGVVVSIPVQPGDVVEAGDVVAVVEAMKMESSLVAPFRGRVREVLVGANVHAAAQAPLVALEPLEAETAPAAGERVRFVPPHPPVPSVAPERCRENLRRLQWLVLGYDIDARRGRVDHRRPARGMRRHARVRPGARPRRAPPAADVRRPASALPSRSRRDRSGRAAAGQSPAAPARVAALPRRRSRGAAGRVPRAAAPRPRSLRGRQPRSHARARGRVLPDVPVRGAGRGGAHGDRRDPRPPPRAGRGARGTRRRRLPRGPRQPGARARRPRPRAGGPRARGALPLLRRAGDRDRPRVRIRRDRGARGRARSRPRASGPRRAPRAAGGLPVAAGAAADRAHARRRAAPAASARRGARAPLLPRPLARGLRGARARGSRLPRGPLPVRGAQTPARGGLRRAPRRRRGRGGVRPSRRHAARGRARRPRPLLGIRAGRSVAPGAGRDAAGGGRRRARCRPRCTGSWWGSPSRAAGAACRRSTSSRSGPAPGASRRTSSFAGCTR